jgi:hypothetical protein
MSAAVNEISGVLMLIPFAIVFATGIFFLFLSVRRSREKKAMAPFAQTNVTSPAPAEMAAPFRPYLFDQPVRWLAVKGNNPVIVQSALDLHHPHPCSWEEGMSEAHEDKLFVSPSINGWILVVGSGLPDPSEDVDECYRFLADLSRKLGHLQFFNTNRVLYHHAWALIEKGQIFRAYAWGGETLWNQGQITAAEKELDVRCFDYGSDQNAFMLKDLFSANCEKVNQLAARWSVDPNAVSESAWNAARGIVGDFSQSKPH